MSHAGRRIICMFTLCFALGFWLARVSAESITPEEKAASGGVNLDFKDADIKDVARAFSHISGVNIIVSDTAKAKITLRIKAADWKEALRMIISAYNLSLIEKPNYLVVTTPERFKVEEESGEIKTAVISLNFINAADLKASVTTMLSTRGKLDTDARSNSLLVTDIQPRIDKIKEVATQLDIKTPQVMIEALMMDVILSDEDQLGIQWTVASAGHADRSISQNLATAFSNALEIKYGHSIFSWEDFNITVQLWQEQKRVKILANPRVLTIDNLPANINIIDQIAYQETTTSTQSSSSISTTQFKDAGIKMTVLPHVTRDGYIFLNIKTEQSFLVAYVNGQPQIATRKAETNLMVRNGETVVIGGLRKKENTDTAEKVPGLGDLPFIGGVFRQKDNTTADTELLIFVTPYIAEPSLSADDTSKLDQFSALKVRANKDTFKKAQPMGLRAPAQ